MRARSEFDVVVIGGGPAGCSVASFLARRGHTVALATRPEPPAPWLGESIPPSARKLLATGGMLEVMERAGFVQNLGNVVWWADTSGREERFPAGSHGFHVQRRELESLFQRSVRAAGATVLSEGPVTSVSRSKGEDWCVSAAGGVEWRANWVVDASGRAGVVARKGLRINETELSTLALAAEWRGGARAPGYTLVESYRDGWAWSVPTSANTRCVTVMFDPRRTGAARGQSGLMDLWRSELDKAGRLSELLSDGAVTGPARVCPASVYRAVRYAEPGLLLVGDAGSFLDPLSSYGVKKALSSAWLAGVVLNTLLSEEEMTSPALATYHQKEEEVVRTYAREALSFLRHAARVHGDEFWVSRSRAAEKAGAQRGSSEEAPTLTDSEAEGFLAGEGVRAAFEAMRTTDRIHFKAGRGVRTVQRPVVVGDRMRLESHLISERCPRATRFVRGIDVLEVVARASKVSGADRVPDIFESCRREMYRRDHSMSLPDFLAVLSFAVTAGFLEIKPEGDATNHIWRRFEQVLTLDVPNEHPSDRPQGDG